MKLLPKTFVNTIRVSVILVSFSGCSTPTPSLDPDVLWQRAEREHADVVDAVAQREQLQADYLAIIRLSRDANLRGQAFVRLAELDMALGKYEQAHHNLEQALRAGLDPVHQRRALLLLGDLLDRHLDDSSAAKTAYQQIVNEHPATLESELALLRLGGFPHEQ